MKNIGMTIGQRIRKTRLEIPMTQTELAEKVGIKQPTISELEKKATPLARPISQLLRQRLASARYGFKPRRVQNIQSKSITPKELLFDNRLSRSNRRRQKHLLRWPVLLRQKLPGGK
ncbi:helix-turn-helix domain-containing protein [Undibacterium arcticum]